MGLADRSAELKVAAFVEEGLSNPEIAARLMLSAADRGDARVAHLEEAERDHQDRYRAGIGAARRRHRLNAGNCQQNR